MVTNDYYRSKSLFSGTKVKVFTKGDEIDNHFGGGGGGGAVGTCNNRPYQ